MPCDQHHSPSATERAALDRALASVAASQHQAVRLCSLLTVLLSLAACGHDDGSQLGAATAIGPAPSVPGMDALAGSKGAAGISATAGTVAAVVVMSAERARRLGVRELPRLGRQWSADRQCRTSRLPRRE